MRFKIFILIFSLAIYSVYAQKFKYAHYHGEEVPFQSVNHVVQDGRGFAWLATDQGLYRFDGHTFDDYNTTLRSKTIRNFVSWDENTLFFTNDTGIHSITNTNGRPQIRSFDINASLHYPTTLFKDSQKRLWTGQMDGSILLFSDAMDTMDRFDLISGEKVPKVVFGEDPFHTIWVLVPEHGLFYFDETTQKFQAVKNYESGNDFLIAGNTIWLVGERLERFEVTRDHTMTNRQLFFSDRKFRNITMNGHGTLFLNSESSLYTLQVQENKAQLSKVFGANDPHRVENLSFGTINHLQFTESEAGHDDVIWVCTDKGLTLLWSSFFQSVSGLGHDNIRAMNSTPEGPVLISQGTVSRIQGKGMAKEFEKVDDLNDIVGIGSIEDKVWYGSAEGMIFQYQGNELKRTYDLSQRGSGVFFIYADHNDNLWVCQAPSDRPVVGAARIDSKGDFSEYGRDKGFDNRILVMREGGKNELYAAGIGAASYLYKYDPSSDRFQNKSLPFPFKVSSNFEVHDMAVDRLGIVWLATTDGLLKYDTETIRKVDLGGVTHNEVRSITAMPNGALWLATDTNGLIHLDGQGNYAVFDEVSGTPSKISSYRCMVLFDNSQLWVGTPEGVVYSSQVHPRPYRTKTPVLKKGVTDNVEIEKNKSIQLKETQKATLSMATLTFPSDDVRYQYKIFENSLSKEDVEDIEWSATHTTELALEGLNGGSYTLWVRGQKSGGFQWSTPLSIPVEVTPKWYRTWWGIGLQVALGFYFFWFFARRWVLKKVGGLQASLSQKQKELEEMEAELVVKSSALQQKKNELKSAGVNSYLLHRLIRQIPKDPHWNVILPILSKLVELPTRMDLFEIGYKKGEVIGYKGYQRGNPDMVTREEVFDEKNNLPSYVLVTDKPLVINDCDKEVRHYISQHDSHGYFSRLYVPFEQKKGNNLVFCVYSKEKNVFSQQTVALLGILVRFLALNVVDELQYHNKDVS